MRIDVEYVRCVINEYRRINALDPTQVELFEGGVPIPAVPNAAEDWKFTGLGLANYVEYEGWKGWQEIA